MHMDFWCSFGVCLHSVDVHLLAIKRITTTKTDNNIICLFACLGRHYLFVLVDDGEKDFLSYIYWIFHLLPGKSSPLGNFLFISLFGLAMAWSTTTTKKLMFEKLKQPHS